LKTLTIHYYVNRLTFIMTLVLTWTIGLSYSLAFYTGMFMLVSKLVQ
jgi:hypothetical protein